MSTSSVRTAQDGGHAVLHSRGMEWIARAGLGARGLVYGVIGSLALELALGAGGRATNQRGALETIAHQPLGRLLLSITAGGLAGYAAWRLVRAAIGHGTRERDSGFERVAAAASGLAYASLCLTAVEILAGVHSKGGSSTPKQTAGGVLAWTGGPEIVALAGLVLLGVGVYQGYNGASKSFLKSTDTSRMSRAVKRSFTVVGIAGHVARMVVFCLVGYGLVKAAVDYNPRQAIGLDGALSQLQSNAYGPALLGIVAAGLIAFALYSIADARYRKV